MAFGFRNEWIKKCGRCFIYPFFSLERKEGGHDGERGMYLSCNWLRRILHLIRSRWLALEPMRSKESLVLRYISCLGCPVKLKTNKWTKTNWPFNSNEIHWENPTHRVDIHKQPPATLFLLWLIAPETTGENMIQNKEMNNDLSIGPVREISIIYFFSCIFPRSWINLIKITPST